MENKVEGVKKSRGDNSSYKLQLLHIAASQTSESISSLVVMAGPFRIYKFRGSSGFFFGKVRMAPIQSFIAF